MSPKPTTGNPLKKDETVAVSRREFLKLASASGVASATSGFAFASNAAGSKSDDGTPEQIHITWGNDPTTEVTISWCSPGRSANPRVKVKGAGEEARTVHAELRVYTDGLNNEIVYSYHARFQGLKPGRAHTYEVTAENDRSRNRPFSSSFQTAPNDFAAVSLDKFRRSRDSEPSLDAFLSAGPLCSDGCRAFPAFVSFIER